MDEWTRRRIDKIAERTLAEAGVAPPVRVEELLEYLRVHRDFYDLEDPTLLQRFWHKVQVHKEQLIRVARKIKLAAVWLPDENRILVDVSQPKPKQEWASFHDGVHRLLDWHRPYFLGDTATTLNPDYQEMLEEEANFGASALMFCGQVFTIEALDTPAEWAGVKLLKAHHQKSWVTTLRRFVEHGPDRPMAMMVSTPWWLEKPDDQPSRVRHFVGSPRFTRQFLGVASDDVIAEVDRNTTIRRGGPVGEFGIGLEDANGELHEFRAESFFNGHYILTLIVHQCRLVARHIVAAT